LKQLNAGKPVSMLFVVLLGFVLVSVFLCISWFLVVFVGFLVALHGDSSMDYQCCRAGDHR
jgi:hypothetical protein